MIIDLKKWDMSNRNILSELAKLDLYLKLTATHIFLSAVFFCGEKLDEWLKQQKSTL